MNMTFAPLVIQTIQVPKPQLWYSINRNMLLIQVIQVKFFKLSPFSILEKSNKVHLRDLCGQIRQARAFHPGDCGSYSH